MWGAATCEDALRQTDSRHGHHHPQPPTNERPPRDSPDDSDDPLDGTWGERGAGDINEDDAMAQYQELRHDLMQLHRTRTHESHATRSRRSFATTGRAPSRAQTDNDVEAAAADHSSDDDDFQLGDFMRGGQFEKRAEDGSPKKVGVVYEHLTVKGITQGASFVRTVPDAILGTFGPDLYHLLCRALPFLRRRQPETRNLIHDFTGCVRDGEMMLVLGRPGAGCTTFLKAVSNSRGSFASVEGDVSYGGIPAETQHRLYRGEINYNAEDDVHFASLSVWKTLTFALLNKTKRADRRDIPVVADALLRMFGIGHTRHTQVGDDFVRGVSGGERKRVSIAETLASKSTVMAWDNSTRGLDASTALDYARSLRIMTDVTNRTTLVTLYQAGEGIYETFDKVLVIDQGRQIYSGPASAAKQYFIDLGFECPERQTTADFLTAVTDPAERRIRPGFQHSAPRTPEALEAAFRVSPAYAALLEDVADYKRHLEATGHADAKRFEGAVRDAKSKHVSDSSPYTVSFAQQVWVCLRREAWLFLGDTTALYTKFFIIFSNAFIVGSLFYGQPADTAGAFTRGGAVFFSVVFLGWLQLSELMKAVSGRDVVARHRDYAFYRPSAVSLARVLLDFPVIASYTALFGLVMYFMTGLDIDAGKFWVYLLFVYTTTIMVTAMYRMFAALSPEIDTAVRFSGIALNVLVIYVGYVIPKPQLLGDYIWFGWLYWINPLSYAFEGVMSNEFAGLEMPCAPSQLVPQGPGVQEGFQGCAASGASANARSVSGEAYLATTYDYSRSNLWRNWAVVIAFAVLYIIATVIATELVSFGSGGGGMLVFKKTSKAKAQAVQDTKPSDEEKAVGADSAGSSQTRVAGEATDAEDEALEQITKSDSIFTWQNLEYTVPYLGGEKKLLNKVSGYAKPGVMVALMGASGAGKTTLLNTLSQRQTVGVISGDMLVDGRALDADFQRNTGFCLQGDIHDRTQTVREALEFSAVLRQEASVSRADKLAHVDRIVELLELGELEDAIISSLGVEQRKRLTIGVELAAKPSLLLFLDEPTSGLDSQSAYSIVRFLKKLSRAGQAIVCTIHQPSSVLIQQFDMVLALNPGGNTFYFGPVGENGKDVIKYFADRGAHCPPSKNVAEFILETAARPHRKPDGSKVNWNDEWASSAEAQAVDDEINALRRTRSEATVPSPNAAARSEFAASAMLQSLELTKRMFRQYWRDPSYLYGKFFTSVIIGIFNGFTFWMLGNTIQDMQNRMFTCFLIITVPPTIVNGVVPKFYDNMSIWQAREYPSRIYGWFAFCTANVLAEIPAAVVSAVLYWVLWYWPTGLPTESSASGYVFLMTLLMFLFMNSWGQWICAFAPSFTVISNVLPFFFVMFALFNGVVRQYSTLPVFWRYWMYWVNPSTYWIGGILAATLADTPVECAPEETALFDAPGGQTCQEYAGAFASSAGGYLLNPDATSGCQYCPFTSGSQYLETLNISADDKWRNFGIFLAFCISNWMLVYFFIYTVRVRGWSFGFGRLFGALGKVAALIKRPFVRKDTKSQN
ncbi:ABC-2 type transporter-domain-containing protein [Plectosphaerella cucumerina]|uniref:ABC-2 type transporter-domain-containing protein n=1 Tax=Plectosphaerella cucumerina TaxID=40658 RepID=A0A8K0TIT0_9PEZI|nr:ABC-2 type transporter-domain-containing protein [Plectosphaerella cucumerina]